ncbi:hypothetical protein NUW54_g8944 [Trametes sanguinea]|uniref:Uncharacterized protein n=1 Tax=Trametes sanguinea TaxID=158606 RepID=A0ACC1PB74_9APHY|nr:hypothetical protein NUW54_g8944 [Trametes sanguinea]
MTCCGRLALRFSTGVCVHIARGRRAAFPHVDVTSPGVWDRESDILYEELCRREAEEEASGQASSSDNHSRPRAKGGKLTEENLKFWLSIVRCACLTLDIHMLNALLEPQGALFSPANTGPVCEVATTALGGGSVGSRTGAA